MNITSLTALCFASTVLFTTPDPAQVSRWNSRVSDCGSEPEECEVIDALFPLELQDGGWLHDAEWWLVARIIPAHEEPLLYFAVKKDVSGRVEALAATTRPGFWSALEDLQASHSGLLRSGPEEALGVRRVLTSSDEHPGLKRIAARFETLRTTIVPPAGIEMDPTVYQLRIEAWGGHADFSVQHLHPSLRKCIDSLSSMLAPMLTPTGVEPDDPNPNKE